MLGKDKNLGAREEIHGNMMGYSIWSLKQWEVPINSIGKQYESNMYWL